MSVRDDLKAIVLSHNAPDNVKVYPEGFDLTLGHLLYESDVDKILSLLDKEVLSGRIDQTIKIKQIVFESNTMGEALSQIQEQQDKLLKKEQG